MNICLGWFILGCPCFKKVVGPRFYDMTCSVAEPGTEPSSSEAQCCIQYRTLGRGREKNIITLFCLVQTFPSQICPATALGTTECLS